MKHVFLLALGWLLVTTAVAQINQTGADGCAQGKTRYFGRLFALGRQMAPTVRSVGDSTIDVTYYGLELRITTAPNYLRAVNTVTLKANVPTLSQFFLDLNSAMTVDSVKSGTQTLTHSHQNNRLTITLPQSISRGQTGRVTVYYRGLPVTPNAELTGAAFVFSTHETTTDPLIYSLSEPFGASDWFPCKDTPADKVDSSAVAITAAPSLVSVSNGLLQGVTTNADGTKTYRWKNSYPIAQYLISIACSNYAQYDNPMPYQGGTLPVTHYVFPEDLNTVKAALAETNNMITVFTNLFGPYPFSREKYGHAQFRWGGGMEHQTITSIIKSAMNRGTISHELMHQWFGDKVTCRNWENIWLNEGFASYGEALYQESLTGAAGYRNYMSGFMSRAIAARGSIYVQDVSSVNAIFDSNRSYAKGATVLHMLRGVLGDSTFFRGMRAYINAPTLSYGTAVTADFQRVMEQTSGQSLEYFFKQWIYGEGYPVYNWSIAPLGGTNSAVLTINRPTVSNPSSFTMPIQVLLRSPAGERTVTVFNDQPVQSFTVTGSGPITSAVLDPNGWILCSKNAGELTLVLATEEPAQVRVFPNPGNDLLTTEFTTRKAGPLTLSLTNLLGQSVVTQHEPLVAAGNQVRRLSIRGLPSGQYIMQLQTADGLRSTAVLVK